MRLPPNNRLAGSLLAAWMAMTALTSSQGARPGDFRFVKEIALAADSTGKVATVVLDEDIFAETADGCTDLRIVDMQEKVVPYVIQVRKQGRPVISEEKLDTVAIGVEKFERNRLEFVLEKKGGGTPTAALVITPQKNFDKRVEVFGSMNTSLWEVVSIETPIFDYSRIIALGNDRINVMPGAHRFFKVVISDFLEKRVSPLESIIRDERGGDVAKEMEQMTVATEDIRVDEIRLMETKQIGVAMEDVVQFYPVYGIACVNDAAGHETVVTLKTRRVPLRSLTFFARNAVFNRAVTVYGSNSDADAGSAGDPADGWDTIASGNISKVDIEGLRREYTTIKFPRTVRYKRYKMVVKNESGPPLQVYGAKAEGELHEAVFLPVSGLKYKLMYGSGSAAVPACGVGAESGSQTGRDQPEECTKSATTPNPLHHAKALLLSRKIDSRVLFMGALVLMVGTLVWLIFRALGKINAR